MPLLADLFLVFAKIGAFTFGGGYAMISIVEDHCVEKKKWITHDDMMQITVIAESTPGPIALNCATFVGYRQAGVLGALVASLGMILPSFVVIYLISRFLDHFLEIKIIASAFKGIRAGVGILILNAAINMLKKMPKKTFPLAVMLCSAAAMLAIDVCSLRFSSVSLMILAALISLALCLIGQKGGAAQ